MVASARHTAGWMVRMACHRDTQQDGWSGWLVTETHSRMDGQDGRSPHRDANSVTLLDAKAVYKLPTDLGYREVRMSQSEPECEPESEPE